MTAVWVARMRDLVIHETHFLCMECGRQICKTSNVVDHHGPILIQFLIQNLLTSPRLAPSMDLLRLFLHILAGGAAGMSSLRILVLGESFHTG